MTQTEEDRLLKYLRKVHRKLYDFSIGAASWQVELAKLDDVITDIMVASAESEKGAGRVMLYYLEMKARHCREMILMRVGKEN